MSTHYGHLLACLGVLLGHPISLKPARLLSFLNFLIISNFSNIYNVLCFPYLSAVETPSNHSLARGRKTERHLRLGIYIEDLRVRWLFATVLHSNKEKL